MTRLVVQSSFSEWLKGSGEVFKVIDDHDSGNVSYGFRDLTGCKYFVKFASAAFIICAEMAPVIFR